MEKYSVHYILGSHMQGDYRIKCLSIVEVVQRKALLDFSLAQLLIQLDSTLLRLLLMHLLLLDLVRYNESTNYFVLKEVCTMWFVCSWHTFYKEVWTYCGEDGNGLWICWCLKGLCCCHILGLTCAWEYGALAISRWFSPMVRLKLQIRASSFHNKNCIGTQQLTSHCFSQHKRDCGDVLKCWQTRIHVITMLFQGGKPRDLLSKHNF